VLAQGIIVDLEIVIVSVGISYVAILIALGNEIGEF